MDKAELRGSRRFVAGPIVIPALVVLMACLTGFCARAVGAKSCDRAVAANLPADHPAAHLAAAEKTPAHEATQNPTTHADDDPAAADKWRTVRMRVTAYCPCAKCCGKYADNITASGHRIQPGDVFVAADKRFPFGTKMIIEGYADSQPVEVLDRGGAIRGNKLDAFFHTHKEALKWGVRYINVKVLVD
ncbi:MAG: 3D domain-containing protein [Phycisphaerales bacterium]|nr:MAG: 3D domain-containing protein [Phycisphaerales bacterium]